jgi:plasmid stabilization system protein ParE
MPDWDSRLILQKYFAVPAPSMSPKVDALWSPAALQDLIDIWIYFAKLASPDCADALIDEIRDAEHLIADNPFGWRERPDLLPGIHGFPVRPTQSSIASRTTLLKLCAFSMNAVTPSAFFRASSISVRLRRRAYMNGGWSSHRLASGAGPLVSESRIVTETETIVNRNVTTFQPRHGRALAV